MKIILTTLNSKFIHSNLAIRYLSSYVKDISRVETYEFTINQNIDFIASEIYRLNPDIVGFSTYIWNLRETLNICNILKKVNPDIKILLGGPEVSFDGKELMEKNTYIDFIIYGEGEETFKEFIQNMLSHRDDFNNIPGLIFRDRERVIQNKERELIRNLNTIPSPYTDIKDEFRDRIVYYESSRGCPFNCKFCLSSSIKGVRYFDIDRVKKELSSLIDGKVKQVKFVDRTFNANKRYAIEIMNFIMDKNPLDINFHFEVTAHLLDEDMLNFLEGAREGLFQFEIGVQSTNDRTIEAVGRTTDFKKLSKVVNRIKSNKNIHQHLDLIAGLPYEDYDIFKNSFNDVYDLRPEKLQLGFLKLLKGSSLRSNEEKYGYKYIDEPPYEVLENKYIDYRDIIRLKGIEDLVEKYYNEGYFQHTLEFIIGNYYKGAFEFYEDFLVYWEKNNYHKVAHSRNNLYNILKDFVEYMDYNHELIIYNLLKYDYIFNNKRPKLPASLQISTEHAVQKNIHSILKDERILSDYLFEYRDIPTKKLMNMVSVESFDVDILQLIQGDYRPIDSNRTYILFDHRDGTINRCIVSNVTKIVEEMI